MLQVEELLRSQAPVTLVTHAAKTANTVLGLAHAALAERADTRVIAPEPVQIRHDGRLFPAVLTALGDATAAIVADRDWARASKRIARGAVGAFGRQLPGVIVGEFLAAVRKVAGDPAVAVLEGSFDAAQRELFPHEAVLEDIAEVTPTLRSDLALGFVTALSELEAGATLILAFRGGERLLEDDRFLLATLAERLDGQRCRLWLDVAVRDQVDREAVRWLVRRATDAGEIRQVIVASADDTRLLMQSLDANMRMAARRLCVLDHPPAAQRVASLLELDLPQWFDVRDRLLRAGLWVEDDAGGLWFDEYHRRALVESLPSDERATYTAAGAAAQKRTPPGFIDPEPLLVRLQLDRFAGREWLTQRLDAFIANTPSGYFVLEAPAGLGKTTYLAWLARLRGYPCHFTSLAPGADEALRNLAAQLAAQWDLGDVAADLPSSSSHASPLRDVLAAAARRRDEQAPGMSLVIAVDGLDGGEVPQPEGNVLALPRELPPGVYILASQRPADVPLSVLGEKRVESFDPDDAANARDVRDYLERVSRTGELRGLLASETARTRFVETLLERSAGVWIYLYHAIADIEARRRAPRDVERLPHGLSAYYADFWRRRSARDPHRWTTVELPLLSALAATREPASLERLRAIAGLELPAERWLFEVLWRAFLTESPTTPGQPRRYALYHESLRDFLSGRSDTAGFGAVDRAFVDELAEATREAHGRIADGYLRAWGGLDAGLPRIREPGLSRTDSGYGIRHVPAHLAEAARWTDLSGVLSAWRFLEAKLAAHGATGVDLEQDCSIALARMPGDHPQRDPVEALRDALVRQSENLRRPDLQPLDQLELQAHVDQAPRLRAVLDRSLRGRPNPLRLAWTTQVTDRPYRRPWRLAPGWVYSLSMSADLSLAVGGDEDGNLIVFDLAAGEIVRRLRGHGGSVRDCRISADGRRAVSKADGADSYVLWDLSSGEQFGVLPVAGVAHWELALSADGRRAVTCNALAGRPVLVLWELDTGVVRREFDSPDIGRAECCAIATDAPRLLSAHRDGTLAFWDLDSAMLLGSVHTNGSSWIECSLTPDGTLALAGALEWAGQDTGSVVVWDLVNGTTRQAPEAPWGESEAFALAAAGRRALSGTWDGLIIAWDLDPASHPRRLYGHTRNAVWSLAASEDGQRALSATKGGNTIEWDLERLSAAPAITGHDDWIWCCAVSADGSRSATASGRRLMVWENSTGRLLEDQRIPGTAMQGLTLDDAGSRACFTYHDRVCYWNIEEGGEMGDADASCPTAGPGDPEVDLWSRFGLRAPPEFAGRRLRLDPSGRLLYATSESRMLAAWRASDLNTVALIDLPGEWLEHCVQIGDDELLVVSTDGTVMLWDLRRQRRRAALCVGELTCATSTTDGTFILAANGAGHVFGLARS